MATTLELDLDDSSAAFEIVKENHNEQDPIKSGRMISKKKMFWYSLLSVFLFSCNETQSPLYKRS